MACQPSWVSDPPRCSSDSSTDVSVQTTALDFTRSARLLSPPLASPQSALESPPYRAARDDRVSLNQARASRLLPDRGCEREGTTETVASIQANSETAVNCIAADVSDTSPTNLNIRGRRSSREAASHSSAADRREPPSRATERRKGRTQPKTRNQTLIETPATIQLRKASVHGLSNPSITSRLHSTIAHLTASILAAKGLPGRSRSAVTVGIGQRRQSSMMATLSALPTGMALHSTFRPSPLSSPTSAERGDYFGDTTVHGSFGMGHSANDVVGLETPRGIAAVISDKNKTVETSSSWNKHAQQSTNLVLNQASCGRRLASLPVNNERRGSQYEVIWHDHIAASSTSGSVSDSPTSTETSPRSGIVASKAEQGSESVWSDNHRSRAVSHVTEGARSRGDSIVFLRSGSWQIRLGEPAAPAITVLQEKVDAPIHLPYPTQYGSSFGHWNWESTAPQASIKRAPTAVSVYDLTLPLASRRISPTQQSTNSVSPTLTLSEVDGGFGQEQVETLPEHSENAFPVQGRWNLESFPGLPPRSSTNDWIRPLPLMGASTEQGIKLTMEDGEGHSRRVSLASLTSSKSPLVRRLEDLAEQDELAPLLKAYTPHSRDSSRIPPLAPSISFMHSRSSSAHDDGKHAGSPDSSIRRTSGRVTGSALGAHQHKRRKSAFVPRDDVLKTAELKRKLSDADRQSRLKIIPIGLVKERHTWIGGTTTTSRSRQDSETSSGMDLDGSGERAQIRSDIIPERKRTRMSYEVRASADAEVSSNNAPMANGMYASPAEEKSGFPFLVPSEIRERYEIQPLFVGVKCRHTDGRDLVPAPERSTAKASLSTGCIKHLHCLERATSNYDGQRLLYVKGTGEMVWCDEKSKLHALGLYGYERAEFLRASRLKKRRLLDRRAVSTEDGRAYDAHTQMGQPVERHEDEVEKESLGMLGFGSPRAERNEIARDAARALLLAEKQARSSPCGQARDKGRKIDEIRKKGASWGGD